MSRSIWINGTNTDVGANVHVPVFGARVGGLIVWPKTLNSIDGTICYLDGVFRVSLEAAPGVGNSRTFTLYKNDNPTAITVTISGTDTTGQDSAHSVDVSSGDHLYLLTAVTGTPTAARLRFSLTLDSSTAGQSILSGRTDIVRLLADTDEYLSFCGSQANAALASSGTWLVFPCAGTVKLLRVLLSHAPGGYFGHWLKRKFTVYKDGNPTAITCTILGNNTACGDAVNSFAVAAGEWIYLKCEPIADLGIWPGRSYVSASVAFEADTPGEFVVPSVASGGFLAPRYHQATVAGDSWTTTESSVYSLAQSIELTRQEVLLNGIANPDPAIGYIIIPKQNGAWKFDLSVTILGNNTSGFATGSVVLEDDDLFTVYGNVVGVNALKRVISVSYLAEVYKPPSAAALLMANF